MPEIDQTYRNKSIAGGRLDTICSAVAERAAQASIVCSRRTGVQELGITLMASIFRYVPDMYICTIL